MRRQILGAAVLGLGLLTAGAGAQEIPPDPTLQGFEPIGDYVVEVDGKPVDSALYHSQRAGSAILVHTPTLGSPVLVLPRERAVRGVPEAKVVERQDGTVDILSGAAMRDHGTFAVDGGEVTFVVGGRRVRLEEKPWLLGFQTTEDMLDYSAGYRFQARRYDPSGPMLRQLGGVAEPVTVRVYFGTWCPHCKENVPKILRVAQELAGSKVSFEYYGLPSPFNKEPQALEERVDGVPTAIVYRRGREIGRLATADWRIPELGLKKIVVGG